MQSLLPVNGRVGNVAGRESLQPVIGNRRARFARNFSQGDVGRRSKKRASSFKEIAHARSLGKVFPNSQGTLSTTKGKDFVMAPKTPPRVTLARNLKLLMEARKLGTPEVAKQSGVDKKTINNLLHGRFDPRLDKVEAVAQVFGLTGWQIIMPGMAESVIEDGQLQNVVEAYTATNAQGRDNISRVAEMAANLYRRK